MAENGQTPPPWYTGNIDLFNRPIYRNRDGSISTVRSMSFYDPKIKKEVLVPTVARVKGKPTLLTDQQAVNRYYKSGKHLGTFNTIDQANTAAQRIHQQQKRYYGG